MKPIKPYLCSATNEMRSAGGDAYPVAPYQAADLVSRGLVEYDNPADEDAAIEVRVKAEGEAIRAARKVR